MPNDKLMGRMVRKKKKNNAPTIESHLKMQEAYFPFGFGVFFPYLERKRKKINIPTNESIINEAFELDIYMDSLTW